MKRFTGETTVGLTPPLQRARLGVEFFALFAVAPALVYTWIDDIVASGERPRGVVFYSLISAVALCGFVLLTDRSFDRRQLWNWQGWRACSRTVLVRFAVLMAVLGVVFALAMPQRLFELPLNRTGLWVAIMLIYPLLSVYPQEVVYRTFIFHRYRALFTSERAMVWASALAFGWAHVILQSWLAVVLTIIGGWLFARTYAQSRSTAAAWIEHALYGCAVFTLGMGAYFYAGAIGMR